MSGTIVTNAELKDAPKQVEDIPLDQITDLAKSMEEVSIRLCRRNERGQVATVYNGIRVRTLDLSKIDDWTREMAGGGRYRCEVKDPMDSGRYVMSPFWFNVEGPPRPPRYLGGPADATPGGAPMSQPPYGGGYAPPPVYPQPQQPMQGQYAPPPSPWSQGLDPSQRVGYQPTPYYAGQPAYAARPVMPPGATTASDELAIRQAGELKAELAQLRAESKALHERMNTENTRLREELAARDRQVAEERHNAQLAALTAKLEALSARPAEVAPKSDVKDWAPLAAAIAPVLAAWIQGQQSSATKSLEVQQQGLQSLMQATLGQASKTSDLEKLITTIGPLLMPLLGDMMKQRSPESQAGLFQAMAENNLNSVAMMAQMIEAFATAGGKEEPWYLPMIKEALGGVVQVAQAYTQQAGGLPGQQPLPPSPSGALAAYNTIEDKPAPAPAAKSNGKPATPGKPAQGLEMLFSLLPSEFQTVEWRAILHGLHAEPPAEAEQVAAMLTSNLEHLVTFNMVPPLLAQVREHPRATLESLLETLPVARSNPAYAKKVLDLTLEYLAEDGFAGAAKPETEEPEQEPPQADEPALDAEVVEAAVPRKPKAKVASA